MEEKDRKEEKEKDRKEEKDREEKDRKKRIKIFSNFCDSTNCKAVFERLSYGESNDVYIVDENDNNFTHVIILNTAMPVLPPKFPKENVIGLAFEPPLFLGLTPEFIAYAQTYIGTYYIGSTDNLSSPFTSGFGYMWHCPLPKSILYQDKPYIMSLMVSEKQFAPGHKYRHKLVQAILGTQYPIHIYGRGCRQYINKGYVKDNRLRGTFQGIELFLPYQFHIGIENFITDDYISEKLMDPLLCNTTPLYLGAKRVEHYFPNMTIALTGNIAHDMILLGNILRNPKAYRKTINIEYVKHRINLLEHLDELYL